MDRQITSQEQTKNKIKKIIPIIMVLALFGTAYYLLTKTFKKTGASSDFHIVTVEKGNIKSTLTAAGTVIAASERVINAHLYLRQ